MSIKNDVLLSADLLVSFLPVSYRELSYCTVKRIQIFVSIRKHYCKIKLWESGCLSYNPTHPIPSYITSFPCAFVLLALKIYETRSFCFIERILVWDEHVRQSGICCVLSSGNCWSCNCPRWCSLPPSFPPVLHLDRWTECAAWEGHDEWPDTEWPRHPAEHGDQAPPTGPGKHPDPGCSSTHPQGAQQLWLRLWL